MIKNISDTPLNDSVVSNKNLSDIELVKLNLYPEIIKRIENNSFGYLSNDYKGDRDCYLYCHIDFIAETGNLEVLKWYYNNYYNFEDVNNVITIACENGYLDILIWAFNNNFVDNNMYFSINYAKNTEIVKILIDNNPEYSDYMV